MPTLTLADLYAELSDGQVMTVVNGLPADEYGWLDLDYAGDEYIRRYMDVPTRQPCKCWLHTVARFIATL